MDEKTFDAVIEAMTEKGSWACLAVPFDVKEVWGTRGRLSVRGAVNDVPFRSSIYPMAGRHIMMVNKAMRDGANAGPGDTVRVVMAPDTEPRPVVVAADVEAALDAAPAAREAFDRLAKSHRREHMAHIDEARQPETRARRIARLVERMGATASAAE